MRPLTVHTVSDEQCEIRMMLATKVSRALLEGKPDLIKKYIEEDFPSQARQFIEETDFTDVIVLGESEEEDTDA